jgi:predicted transposase/invertase (TIGR01784 family)
LGRLSPAWSFVDLWLWAYNFPMADLSNPHDRFFKELFSRKEAAQEFLRLYLPPEVAALLDPATLELTKDSFIDPELQEHFSDMLYKITLSQQQPAYIYLLFEHKSYPDKLVACHWKDEG